MHTFSALPFSLLAPLLTAARVAAQSVDINVVTPVTCSRPTRIGDIIAVDYRGRLLDSGAEFDNSYKRGVPFTFTLGKHEVIAGWDQGLMDMCPGEARELTIPPELAYGSRGVGGIPPDATLVFDTSLVEILGVVQEGTKTEETGDEAFGIATAPATPIVTSSVGDEKHVHDQVAQGHDHDQQPVDGNGDCQLLGPFALIVQGALGAMALLALVFKRFRETPKRPWKIWLFDASKQVMGSMLLHVINLLMSMVGAGDLGSKSATAAATTMAAKVLGQPNPCSFYILNLGIDTTIGVPILYVLLKVFHSLYLRTSLANPPESIKSGHYGNPPQLTWYLKQLLIYFTGLIFMKLFVWFLFAALPWLPWVGDWALRWTEGNEALQIAFTMFLFPLAMNVVQYYVIDNFLMEKQVGEEGGKYQRVDAEEEGAEEREGSGTLVVDEEDEEDDNRSKLGESEGLTEVNPTPLPERSGEGSGGRNTPTKKGD